ncbi:MAG: hypothetical protein QM791_16865 [Ferruginibacter sp.]
MRKSFSKNCAWLAVHCVCTVVLCCCSYSGRAQYIDIETVGKSLNDKIKDKKPFKISGGINANTIFYTGNTGNTRDPFNYLLSGNVTMSLYGFTVPASFSLTNQGFSHQYSYPRPPTRLSLHPKYKWITGHIGTVSMSLSPYTFNGMVFTGAGADITPAGSKFKYSFLYGRLQKAVEYKPGNGNTQATYKRSGYGVKVLYDNGPFKLGTAVFRGKDDMGSLAFKPDSLQIFPQENTAVSFETSVPLIKNVLFKVEYGLSVFTRDQRSPKITDSTKVSGLVKLLGGRLSSSLYKALKTELSYTVGSAMIGVGYERVDPEFQTLGSYYFTNDIENITANFARALFKGKINLSGNIGLQRDNLDNKKSSVSRRNVGAVNVSYVGSKRFTATVSYSNFQSFTNIRPQFQYINQQTPFDNLDTLNYRQLSQNTNANFNYILSESQERPQNLNVNISMQDAYDMQGGVILKGNASRFYNFAGNYSRSVMPKSLSISVGYNLTFNQIAGNNLLTMGPSIGANKKFFNNKVSTGASLSYNSTTAAGKMLNSVAAVRMNAAYVYKKKHNLGMNLMGMRRENSKGPSVKDITATITYSYSF